MRKLLCALLASLLLFSGCAKPGKYVKITAEEMKQKFDSKESFIFFVAMTTCENCAKYFDYLDEYLTDHPLTIYYVVADAPENEETFDELWDNYFPMVERTPTTVVVKEGVIQTEPEPAIGYLLPEELDQYLKDSKITLPNE
ncbi:MAG: hypothetical protein IIZ48_01550 [Erysipelotrichales bacterium]|nr:hypothetical protein [Erysipelotrichales bacterium]